MCFTVITFAIKREGIVFVRFKKIIFISSIIIGLFSNVMLFSSAQNKGKDKSVALDDAQVETTTEISKGDSPKEVEKVNPAETYKLIAIYLVGKKPRALVKNTSIPEEGPKEYQEGDYLDELQTISVSRILLNPTSGVELIDQYGEDYLLKPQISEKQTAGTNQNGSTFSYGKKFGAAMISSPTYKSGRKTTTSPGTQVQDNSAIKPQGSAETQAAQPPPQPSQSPSPPQAQANQQQPAQDTQQGQQAVQPAQPQPQQTATPPANALTTSQDKPSSQTQKPQDASTAAPAAGQANDSLDRERPKNPFE